MTSKVVIAIVTVVLLSAEASAAWKKLPSNTMAWLHAAQFVDARQGWIVGSKGTLLVSEDGGTSWVVSKKFTNDTIRDIYFADQLRGWLLCERSPFGGTSEPLAYLVSTRDGGTTWQRHDPFQTRDRVVRIVFRDAEEGCAMGEGGYLSCTDDGGRTWMKHELPARHLMMDGRFLDQDTLVLAGGGGTLLRSERGQSEWMRAATPTGLSTKLNSVHFLDQKTGWAVGAGGEILFTANGGQTWGAQSSTVTKDLRDVWFDDHRRGYAVGDDGVILRTEDGGMSWTKETSPSGHRLEAIAVAGGRIIAVGFGGTILVSEFVPSVERQN